MKPELEKRCNGFIAATEEVRKAFRWDSREALSVCAGIFCAHGRTADAERLKECRKTIEAQAGRFSRFRGKARSILCCMLALSDSPEEMMARAAGYYSLLKREFKDTEYLALSAFLLAGPEDDGRTAERIARGKEIYRRMDKDHPVLTNDMDSFFAVMLAYSKKTDDELAADLEACYKALKVKFSAGGSQTAAQILMSAAGTPEERTQRLIALYGALREAEVKYGQSAELAPLAALPLADGSVPDLVQEIKDADAFLKEQKGYGTGGIKQEERAVHAVMIVSGLYADAEKVNPSMMANTLDMLISKQKALYVSLATHALEFAARILLEAGKQQAEQKDPAESAAPEAAEGGVTETAGAGTGGAEKETAARP